MPPHTRRRGSHALLFGAAGWLFADLLLALAMAFLVANTFGVMPPPKPTPIVQVPPTPTPTATPIPPPALDLKAITLTIQIDYQGILNGDADAIASAKSKVRANTKLASKHAGLVLAFGGSGQEAPAFGTQVAKAFDKNVLASLGDQNYVFQTTVYREFFQLGGDPSVMKIDVYVFKE